MRAVQTAQVLISGYMRNAFCCGLLLLRSGMLHTTSTASIPAGARSARSQFMLRNTNCLHGQVVHSDIAAVGLCHSLLWSYPAVNSNFHAARQHANRSRSCNHCSPCHTRLHAAPTLKFMVNLLPDHNGINDDTAAADMRSSCDLKSVTSSGWLGPRGVPALIER
jgi:hypothetical protein